MSEKAQLRRIVLEKLRISIEQAISLRDMNFARNHAEMSAQIDDFARALIIRLATYLLAGPEEVRVDVEEKWPADWWQAFRERWAPRWWLRRWPVRYKTLSIHRRLKTRVCPHANVKTDRDHLEWLVCTEVPLAEMPPEVPR